MNRIKRYLGIILIISLLVCDGCGFNGFENVNPQYPDQISINGATISYTGNEYNNLKKYVHVTNKENKLMAIEREAKENNDDICIIVNEKKKVRLILANNSNVITYKGITVGDKTSDIEKNFKYINKEFKNYYVVYFHNNEEVDLFAGKLLDDDDIAIQYKIENGVIVSILISDLYFMRCLN